MADDHNAELINPLSREIINLPNIDTFPEFLETSEWDNGISKLVFLPQSSLVVVLWGCSAKLGFCRIGDKKWTSVEKGWKGQIFDITYYNGRVFSFDCNNQIRACDVLGEDPTKLVDVSRLPEYLYDKWLGGAYILGLDDDDGRRTLLVVIREGMFDDFELREESYKTEFSSFQV